MVTFDERGNIRDHYNSHMYGYADEHVPYHITFEELDDVCQLIKRGKMPNGKFGDDEVSAWEIIHRVLNEFVPDYK